jgi:hypothetical protein
MKTYAIDNGEEYSDHDISFCELPDDVTKEDLEEFFKLFRPNYQVLFVSKNIDWCDENTPNQWSDSVYNCATTIPDKDKLKNIHIFFLERSLKNIEETISWDKKLITKWTDNEEKFSDIKSLNKSILAAQQRIEQSKKAQEIIAEVIAERNDK